ncbi:MAG TPA: hypothetical protein VLQ65_02075 [Saliniramus sp.]|nr:hypothetical protein [Saliniramus sp.]
MNSISFANRTNSAAQFDNDSRGNPAQMSSAAADKAKFDAVFGAGVNSGAPLIGITLKPNGGAAADPATIQPHAMLQLLPPGPLVAGQRVGHGDASDLAAAGAPGPLVAERKENSENSARAHANPALRTVFDAAVDRRRADLEVPSTVAGGMEAGRERLVRDMELEAADPASGTSSASFTAASQGGGSSSVDASRITALMSAPVSGSPADAAGPLQSGSSDVAPTNAPMTISLSPAGSSTQAFSVPAPRISTAEIGQAMHRALAAAQQERPITETREKDLVRAQQERPIDTILMEELEAAKAKLSLPGGERELLISTLEESDEAGVVDLEAQMALLDRANELTHAKYQMILDDFSSRVAKRDAAATETVSA